jgi:hypothetical protein
MEPKPVVKLVGEDGNAYAIMSTCRQAARKAKWDVDRIERLLAEMQSGDYDHLLQVVVREFDVR